MLLARLLQRLPPADAIRWCMGSVSGAELEAMLYGTGERPRSTAGLSSADRSLQNALDGRYSIGLKALYHGSSEDVVT